VRESGCLAVSKGVQADVWVSTAQKRNPADSWTTWERMEGSDLAVPNFVLEVGMLEGEASLEAAADEYLTGDLADKVRASFLPLLVPSHSGHAVVVDQRCLDNFHRWPAWRHHESTTDDYLCSAHQRPSKRSLSKDISTAVILSVRRLASWRSEHSRIPLCRQERHFTASQPPISRQPASAHGPFHRALHLQAPVQELADAQGPSLSSLSQQYLRRGCLCMDTMHENFTPLLCPLWKAQRVFRFGVPSFFENGVAA
jgi:hypothetical protein